MRLPERPETAARTPRLACPQASVVVSRSRRRFRRRRHRRKTGAAFFFNSGADLRYRRTRRVHLPPPRGDVDAHGAFKTVRFPLDHVAILRPRSHEAVSRALVSTLLSPAERGDGAGDL